jgi:hypothetical protein
VSAPETELASRIAYLAAKIGRSLAPVAATRDVWRDELELLAAEVEAVESELSSAKKLIRVHEAYSEMNSCA